MEYIINMYNKDLTENSIPQRAAALVQLNLTQLKGSIAVYNDFGLNSKQKEFKKMINKLIEDFEEGYSGYKYTQDDILEAKTFLKNITPNSRKTRA